MDDVYAACDALEPLGYGFKKKPDEGEFTSDPRLIPRLSCCCAVTAQIQRCKIPWTVALAAHMRAPAALHCALRVGGMKGIAFACKCLCCSTSPAWMLGCVRWR